MSIFSGRPSPARSTWSPGRTPRPRGGVPTCPERAPPARDERGSPACPERGSPADRRGSPAAPTGTAAGSEPRTSPPPRSAD
eukprot:838345-Prorocentrum_minimum.AAC.1